MNSDVRFDAPRERGPRRKMLNARRTAKPNVRALEIWRSLHRDKSAWSAFVMRLSWRLARMNDGLGLFDLPTERTGRKPCLNDRSRTVLLQASLEQQHPPAFACC